MKKTKIRINVIITNKTTKDTSNISCLGIKQDNKITYICDNIKNSIELLNNKIIIKRSSHNYQNIIDLNNTNGKSTITIPEGTIKLLLDTKKIIKKENYIKINYIVKETNEEYELIIEIGEII